MRIVCSLVSVTVIFQLELFIILNVNYRNVCSSNRPQLRVLPGSSISAPWRVDFRNWQVDYCLGVEYGCVNEQRDPVTSGRSRKVPCNRFVRIV